MNTNIIIAILVAAAVGAGIGYAFASEKTIVPKGAHIMPDGSVMSDSTAGGMHGAMGDMMAGLEGKSGDEFDKAFLEEMIIHHEGAIDMAEAALQNAKHEEIKSMANAIISTQSLEIAQMKAWLQSWYAQ